MTVFQSNAVKVVTVYQPSARPSLCQLLCYSPGLCSYKRGLSPHLPGAQTVLGALWIMTGLLHIALGIFTIFISPYMGDYLMFTTYFPVWMGAVFLFLGLICVLSERRPRPLFVLLSGLLNLAGVVLCVAAVVLFAFGFDGVRYHNNCSEGEFDWWSYVEQEKLLEQCRQARELRWNLMSSVDAADIALFVLDVCIGLCSAVISFKTLKKGVRGSGSKPLLTDAKETKETK